jgi:hypothetical protein
MLFMKIQKITDRGRQGPGEGTSQNPDDEEARQPHQADRFLPVRTGEAETLPTKGQRQDREKGQRRPHAPERPVLNQFVERGAPAALEIASENRDPEPKSDDDEGQ